jgi:LacI family transcriptional regulator
MAAGVLHVARHLGLDVPREISVAGFDDSPLARVYPTLTTVPAGAGDGRAVRASPHR